MQQVKFAPLADITSLMSGTEALWPLEVTAVYINGVAGSFTWSTDGTLSIPFYSVGTVFVEFTLYLLYDAPSQYLPSDPTDPGSQLVYWENRIATFVSISTSIGGFESGLNEINIGSIQVRIDDAWLMLLTQQLIMPNSVIRVYNNGVIVFKGIASKHSVSSYTININIQKRFTVLDSECNFNDPPYLNRIDRSVSTAYYNGANIPERFDGYVIPMLFGPATRYEIGDSREVDIGEDLVAGAPRPKLKRSQRIVRMGDGEILRIIPTSATTGIIGRMPIYQNISTDTSDIPINTVNSTHFVSKDQLIWSNPTSFNNMLPGEACNLFRSSDSKTVACIVRKKENDFLLGPITSFLLGKDDYDITSFGSIRDSDRYIHIFPDSVRDLWVRPVISSGSFTPGNNRFLTISFTSPQINLLTDDCFIVLNNVTGSKTPAEVLKFCLEQHGFTVDAASFAALATEFNIKTLQQVGIDKNMPTLANLISEINMSLMTLLIFPSDNDIPYLKKIDSDEPASLTVYEKQIAGLSFTSEYREQAANVQFNPKYALSDSQKTNLYRDIDAPNTNIFASERTLNVPHILYELNSNVIDRWDKITEIYGAPVTVVQLDIVDSSVLIEVGDVINIDHTMFKQKILITSIEQKPIGRTIQGRYFYVNQN